MAIYFTRINCLLYLFVRDFICNKTWWPKRNEILFLLFFVTVKWEQSIKYDIIAACNWFLINCRFVGVFVDVLFVFAVVYIFWNVLLCLQQCLREKSTKSKVKGTKMNKFDKIEFTYLLLPIHTHTHTEYSKITNLAKC